MENLPLWVQRSIIGLAILAAMFLIILSFLYGDREKDKGIISSPNPPENAIEDATIIVEDSKTEIPLEDVDLEIITKEGVIHDKTMLLAAIDFKYQGKN